MSKLLKNGVTFHAPQSGSLAVQYGLVDSASGWHYATLWQNPNGQVYLRPRNGSDDALCVGLVQRGRFVPTLSPVRVASRQRAARVELAQAGLLWLLNGAENTFALTCLEWTRCLECGRLLSAGTSIVGGVGPQCANKGATTGRQTRRVAGLSAMQALIDAGRRA